MTGVQTCALPIFCFKSHAGSPTTFFLANYASGYVGTFDVALTITSSWQCTNLPVTVNGTTDVWEIYTTGGVSQTNITDLDVFGAQLCEGAQCGAYAVTTTSAIDLTAYFPFAAGFTLGANLESSLDGTGTVGVTETGGTITENTSGTAAKATALAATPGSATNQAMCWKAAGVPGYCSTVVGATGACTCN